MTQYYDPDSRSIKRVVYTWDDTNDSSTSWEDLTEWETGTGGLYTLGAGDPITFRSEIKDFGRVADVNPLCSVVAVGTVNIKVFAADNIDSSSQLPGDPVIIGGQAQTLQGVTGRYFQFLVEVTDESDALAEIVSVRTDLNSVEQTESITGDSATHGGSQTMRLAPLTREYSKLTALQGQGEATQFIVPLVTVGSLTDPTQARYRVWNLIGGTVDSSTVPGIIKDFVEPSPKSISKLGGANGTDNHSKWGDYSIYLPDNGAIRFDGGGVTTGDFNMQAWVKIETDGGYFFKVSGTSPSFDFRVKSVTDSTGVEFYYSINGGSSYVSMGTDTSGSDFYYFYLNKNSNTLNLNVGATGVTPYISNNNWDMSNATFEWGGNYVGSGDYYVDNIRYSDITRSFSTPTAEFIIDSDTVALVDVEAQSEEFLVPAVTATDAVVNLVVRGLPKLVSDDDGNIVEQTS